jgi:ABC-type uncharacterized transport system substrate-binding protein
MIARRELFALLSGAVAAWPLAARAQQARPVRRVGIMIGLPESDQEAQTRVVAFREALQKLGWAEGQNVRFEYRWASGDAGRMRADADELVALAPDVILISSQAVFDPMSKAAKTIPVVFVQVTDPFSSGVVASLARPGGNFTGFSVDASVRGKLLEILNEIAPNVTEAAVIYNPNNASNLEQLHALEAASASTRMKLSSVALRNRFDLEPGIVSFSRTSNGGLIVLPTFDTSVNRNLIIGLATRYRLPAIYPYRYFVTGGGLASYGVDNREEYRKAAAYVDRILKGERPGDLPVQLPTKYELVINLQAAKLIDLKIPESVVSLADEVIE